MGEFAEKETLIDILVLACDVLARLMIVLDDDEVECFHVSSCAVRAHCGFD